MTGLWITSGVCVLLAVLLFCGRCGFIIIGYNTAPPEVKEKYDKKKLLQKLREDLAKMHYNRDSGAYA